jgi:hypothetical protein
MERSGYFHVILPVPHPVRALLSFLAPPCSLVDNSEINFQCGMKIHHDYEITAKCLASCDTFGNDATDTVAS